MLEAQLAAGARQAALRIPECHQARRVAQSWLLQVQGEMGRPPTGVARAETESSFRIPEPKPQGGNPFPSPQL